MLPGPARAQASGAAGPSGRQLPWSGRAGKRIPLSSPHKKERLSTTHARAGHEEGRGGRQRINDDLFLDCVEQISLYSRSHPQPVRALST